MSETPLSAEQTQRLEALRNVAEALRFRDSDGGSSAPASADLIDATHYVVTGVPFVLAWRHEHQCNPQFDVEFVKIDPGNPEYADFNDFITSFIMNHTDDEPTIKTDPDADIGQTDEHGVRTDPEPRDGFFG